MEVSKICSVRSNEMGGGCRQLQELEPVHMLCMYLYLHYYCVPGNIEMHNLYYFFVN